MSLKISFVVVARRKGRGSREIYREHVAGLNGRPSPNYIHFTCHLAFKNRKHGSLGEVETEPGRVYDTPEKGQTHLHQKCRSADTGAAAPQSIRVPV